MVFCYVCCALRVCSVLPLLRVLFVFLFLPCKFLCCVTFALFVRVYVLFRCRCFVVVFVVLPCGVRVVCLFVVVVVFL